MSSESIFLASLRTASVAAFFALALTGVARAAACPRPLALESSNGRYYVAVFAAPAVTRASFGLTLYSRSGAYSATLSSIALDRPWTRGGKEAGFRSYTALLNNPGEEPLLGALVRSFDLPGDAFCATQEWIMPSVDAVRAYSLAGAPEHDLYDAIATEAGDGSNAVALTPVALPSPFECPAPFAPAKVTKLATPEGGANPSGTVVRVDLSETGSVTSVAIARSSGSAAFDEAALAAARKSSYTPRVFGCVAERSTYAYLVAKP